MKKHLFMRLCSLMIMLIGASPALIHTQAQEPVYPLPAPLYILTSDHAVLRLDPQTGAQTMVSTVDQPVIDFAVAPDGEWIAWRTMDSGAVVITEIGGMSGYVLDFDSFGPLHDTRRSIAWTDDSSALAFIDATYVRIAEFGKGEYGAPIFSNYAGTWTDLFWSDPANLYVYDASGNPFLLNGGNGSWTSTVMNADPIHPIRSVETMLRSEGVEIVDRGLVPNTAGALAFDWGPPPVPTLSPRALPTNLYYLAANESGITQVWQINWVDAQPRALTNEPVPVTHYAISPVAGRLAYITSNSLITTDADGANRLNITQVNLQQAGASLNWSPEGSQVAYHDSVGVWTVPGNGSSPPRQIVGHRLPQLGDDQLSVQVFLNPRWSPDGAQLLVTIGLWEGSQQAIINIENGVLSELNTYNSRAAWTQDKQVLSWSASMGYEMPGLFLTDPVMPQLQPTELIPLGTPVVAAFQPADGSIIIVKPGSAQMGPQYVQLEIAPALGTTFAPMPNAVGGYLSQPQIMLGSDQTMVVAGLRNMTYNNEGVASGDLVLLDPMTGDLGRVPTNGPVSRIQWGP